MVRNIYFLQVQLYVLTFASTDISLEQLLTTIPVVVNPLSYERTQKSNFFKTKLIDDLVLYWLDHCFSYIFLSFCFHFTTFFTILGVHHVIFCKVRRSASGKWFRLVFQSKAELLHCSFYTLKNFAVPKLLRLQHLCMMVTFSRCEWERMLRKESYSSRKIMFVFVAPASSLFSLDAGVRSGVGGLHWGYYCMNRQSEPQIYSTYVLRYKVYDTVNLWSEQKGCSCSRGKEQKACRMKGKSSTVGKSYRWEQVQR